MSYYDYIKDNTDTDCLYVVTEYGCNSSPNNLWTPRNTIFKVFNDAYEYFISVSPELNDAYITAEKYIAEFNVSDLSKYQVVVRVSNTPTKNI